MNAAKVDHDDRMSRLLGVIENDPGSLIRCTPSSYRAVFVALFGAWLERRGWTRQDGRSYVEYARYTTERGQLIVTYMSGSVLVQAKHTDDTHKLLAPLVEAEVPQR